EDTDAPNAEAVGLGPSRRVVLWDTVQRGGFRRREVRVVLAHEYGHQAHDDILRSVAWTALLLLPLALLVEWACRRRGGLREPAAVPLALFVVLLAQIVALPATNAVTRRMETAADWAALQTTHDPAGAEALFRR